MKKLTAREELEILNELLKNVKMLGCGSSRATYKLNDKLAVKVVNCDSGKVQNECEVKTFERYSNTGYLAKIYGYGRNIIVMDLVKDAKRRYYSSQDRIRDLNEFLENTLQADDGCQSGYNVNGELVLFDYGLEYGEARENVGHIYRIADMPNGDKKVLEIAKRQVMQSIFQR